ncbi:MAG: hypothetical protein GF411_01840 [Candidatus Lokiarchaeota archaeon]|nr:hypothetical protein [Candidatus Lokiarchaeota archaeon]
MTIDRPWDYSQIPPAEWKWDFEYGHWIDLRVTSEGLRYIGNNMTIQSGGAYFAGFQTFDEFFEAGPIQKMPEDVESEVKAYLKKHRTIGGATFHLVFLSEIQDFWLWRVYLHIDESPTKIEEIEKKPKEEQTSLYQGSISLGIHTIGFVLVVRSEERYLKYNGEFEITIKHGLNHGIIRLFQDNKGQNKIEFIAKSEGN